MKIKSIVALISFSLIASCSSDEEPSLSKTELLTGGLVKSWNQSAASPDNSDAECKIGTAYLSDNAWVFSNDGTFTYDHGVVTESSTGKCGDFKNLTGQWRFTENESNLLITLSYETDDPLNIFYGDTLLMGSIESLTQSALIIENDDGRITFTPKK